MKRLLLFFFHVCYFKIHHLDAEKGLMKEVNSHELIVWALYLLEMQQVKRFNYAIDVNL